MRATKLFLVTARTFIDYSYKNLMISVTTHIKFGKSSILQLVLRVIFTFSYPHLRLNPCSRRPLPTRGASVGIMWQAQTGVIVFSLYVCVAPYKNVRRQSQDVSSRQSNCWWGRWETMKLKYSSERIIALGSIFSIKTYKWKLFQRPAAYTWLWQFFEGYLLPNALTINVLCFVLNVFTGFGLTT